MLLTSLLRRPAIPSPGGTAEPTDAAVILDPYRWAAQGTRPAFRDGGCVTVIAGAGVAEVMAAYGAAVSAAPVPLTHRAGFIVAAAEVPGGVVVLEPNGYRGGRADVLRRVSKSGRALSVYWCPPDVDLQIALASGGQMLTTFDPGYDDPREAAAAAGVAWLLEDLADLALDESSWVAAGLLMGARFTGVEATRECLAACATAYPIHLNG